MKLILVAACALLYVAYRALHAEMLHVVLGLHSAPPLTQLDALLGVALHITNSLHINNIVAQANALDREDAKNLAQLRKTHDELMNVAIKVSAPTQVMECMRGKTCKRTEMHVQSRESHKIPIIVYKLNNPTQQGRIVVYFHGGGMVLGSAQDSAFGPLFGMELNASIVVAVEYRKAPEFPYPVALHDGFDVLEWVVANHATTFASADLNLLTLAGESAGGLMTAAVAQQWRDAKREPQIDTMLLAIPMLSPVLSTSYAKFKDIHGLPLEMMSFFWQMYISPQSSLYECAMDALCSPLAATVERMQGIAKRAIVISCNADVLLDESLAYAQKLTNAGVKVHALRLNGTHTAGMPLNLAKMREFFYRVN